MLRYIYLFTRDTHTHTHTSGCVADPNFFGQGRRGIFVMMIHDREKLDFSKHFFFYLSRMDIVSPFTLCGFISVVPGMCDLIAFL